MTRNRKVSESPDVDSIQEQEQEFQSSEIESVQPTDPVININSENRHPPPQMPDKSVGMEIHTKYINNALLWLRRELQDLQKQDKDLMRTYKEMMRTIHALKKNETRGSSTKFEQH